MYIITGEDDKRFDVLNIKEQYNSAEGVMDEEVLMEISFPANISMDEIKQYFELDVISFQIYRESNNSSILKENCHLNYINSYEDEKNNTFIQVGLTED